MYRRTMRGRRRILAAISTGFDSLTLDPSARMRKLQAEIARRNTVAEAWEQTHEVMHTSMKQVKASSSK